MERPRRSAAIEAGKLVKAIAQHEKGSGRASARAVEASEDGSHSARKVNEDPTFARQRVIAELNKSASPSAYELPLEVKIAIANHLGHRWTAVVNLSMCSKTWYSALSQEGLWRKRSYAHGAVTRARLCSWMTTFTKKLSTVCFVCKLLCTNPFPYVADVPSIAQLCGQCMKGSDEYKLVSWSTGRTYYGLTFQELSSITPDREMQSSEYYRVVLASKVLAIYNQKKATNLAIIGNTFLGDQAPLLAALEAGEEATKTSLLKRKYMGLVAASDVVQEDVYSFVNFYMIYPLVEQNVIQALQDAKKSRLENKAVSWLTCKFIDHIDALSVSITWGEAIADGRKTITDLISSLEIGQRGANGCAGKGGNCVNSPAKACKLNCCGSCCDGQAASALPDTQLIYVHDLCSGPCIRHKKTVAATQRTSASTGATRPRPETNLAPSIPPAVQPIAPVASTSALPAASTSAILNSTIGASTTANANNTAGAFVDVNTHASNNTSVPRERVVIALD